MNLGLQSPCKSCPNLNCRKYKECKAWRLWFENEWFRVRMMFMEDENELRKTSN